MKTHSEARSTIVSELQQVGWQVSPEALKPLGRIDFAKLVGIYDHEERFLEETFISTLLTVRGARASTAQDEGMVTADDLETALRMLGVAAARQSRATLSDDSKAKIKDACGFC